MFIQNKSELCKKSGALLLDRQELIFAKKAINSEIKTIWQNSQYLWSHFLHAIPTVYQLDSVQVTYSD